MLTYADAPTIRHAIIRRLSKEVGVAIADIKIEDRPDCIRVGVWLLRVDLPTEDGIVDTRSWFELPKQFYLRDLHNQIDEVAEQSKIAKREAGLKIIHRPGLEAMRKDIIGTGLRGSWKASEHEQPHSN